MGNRAFAISVAAVFAVTAAVIICAAASRGTALAFARDYYFVCYSIRDNAISADAISDTVTSYGGAGYVLEYGGNYYVTVACYYTENEAKTVKNSLLRRGLNCSVLTVTAGNYFVKSSVSKQRRELYEGNLNTLNSLSELCYRCANSLDTGEIDQASAAGVLKDVQSGLDGLKRANRSNCFTGGIDRLIAECNAAGAEYIFSKSMRKLQIAIADFIINVNIY